MVASFSEESNSASSTSPSKTNPTALPSEEALELLLSPDGYYAYLGISKPDPSLLTPKYAATNPATAAATASENTIDLDQVKKNYRRLSLRHHPDRKTGDPETFRILHRAKVVLSSPKLRREYDLIGLDLDDDAEDHDHHEDGAGKSGSVDDNGGEGSEDKSDGDTHKEGGKSSTETVMGHLASSTLAAVLQMVVRTGLMGLVSVLLSRYTILTFLALGGLAFVAYRIYSALRKALGPTAKMNFILMKDVLSPLTIALGIFCMYRGRRFVIAHAGGPSIDGSDGNVSGVVGDSTVGESEGLESTSYSPWSWTFWFGETLVMTLFISNSFENRPPALTGAFAIVSLLVTLWLRGKFWRYATLLGFEGIIALLIVMAFPIMEMILEEIVQEKMRKVGEKIRAHDVRVKEFMKKRKGGKSSS